MDDIGLKVYDPKTPATLQGIETEMDKITLPETNIAHENHNFPW